MKKSWKTTLGGILTSLGLLGTQYPDPTVAKIAAGVAALGALLTGGAARDNGVSSESAGAK